MQVSKNQKTLRCGITSGSCAAAAAKAATQLLLFGVYEDKIIIDTPKGIKLDIPVKVYYEDSKKCRAIVIKDSGDDPDVTNKTEIHAVVEYGKGDLETAFFGVPRLWLFGGNGVGIVTKNGLEQKIGLPAINKVPRKMIFDAVKSVYEKSDCRKEIKITIEVPFGKDLAKKTFNPQLGIEGGISILGTSGIIEPMSEKAIVDTIGVHIKQLSTNGYKNIVIVPGNYGMSYLKQLGIMDENAVKCSNYIGETLDFAVTEKMQRVLLVGNIGKLIKLAAGIMNTHSKVADGRAEIMAVHAVLCGGSIETAGKIMNCINTEEMLGILEEQSLIEKAIESICLKIKQHLDQRVHNEIDCSVVLFSEKYGLLGMTVGANEIIEKLKRGDIR